MTVSTKKSRASSSTYYTRVAGLNDGLAVPIKPGNVDDAYSQAKEPPGTFYAGECPVTGSRKNGLGINDGHIISAQDANRFANLVQGFHPDTKTRLVQNAGSSPSRVAFFDFTTSAPKSVSVVWSQANRELKCKIEQAQLNASRKFLDLLSTKAYSRRGKGGTIKTPVALLAAQWSHASSRAGDPQLHTHNTVFNVSERPHDRSTGAIETLEMMRWIGAAASIYHADLAYSMRQMSFAIARRENLFEMAGVPEEVKAHFSKRRAQIVDAVEKEFLKMGLDPATSRHYGGLFDKAAIETRTNKSELTREQLQEAWHHAGLRLGFSDQEVIKLMSSPFQELTDDEVMAQTRTAIADLNTTEAVFKEPLLLTKIAIHLMGRASTEQILAGFQNIKNSELLVSQSINKLTGDVEPVFSTTEQLTIEREMLDLAESLASRRRRAVGNVNPHSLDLEQHQAAIAATTAGDLTVIEGVDDSRRTCTAKVIASLYSSNANAYRTFVFTPVLARADRLQRKLQSDGIQVRSLDLAKLTSAVTNGEMKLDSKSLILVDDAGLIGSRDMRQILAIASAAESKVVLLGETKQAKPNSCGDAQRAISDRIGSSRINVDRMQSDERERQSVLEFLNGNISEGLKPYLAKGNVHILADRDSMQRQMIQDWNESRTMNPRQSILMIASDSASALELNRLAREVRKAAGELLDGRMLRTMDCRKASESLEFCVNDHVQLRLTRMDLRQYVANQNHGAIEGFDGEEIHVRMDQGDLKTINVNDKKWLHKTAGGLALQHGYCLTTYSCRGQSAETILFADAIDLNRANASMAMSRHSRSCDIYVDRQARYEARMRRSERDDWVPFSQFSDEDCLAEMAMSWSLVSEKSSTLDFETWTRAGCLVDSRSELVIAKIKRALKVTRYDGIAVRQTDFNQLQPFEPRTGTAQIDYSAKSNTPIEPQGVDAAVVTRSTVTTSHLDLFLENEISAQRATAPDEDIEDQPGRDQDRS